MYQRMIKYRAGYLCCTRRASILHRIAIFTLRRAHTRPGSHVRRVTKSHKGYTRAYDFTRRIICRNCKTGKITVRNVPCSDYCPLVWSQLGNNQSPNAYHVSYSLAKWNLALVNEETNNRGPPTISGEDDQKKSARIQYCN